MMRFLIKYLFILFFVSILTGLYLLCCTPEGLIFNIQHIAPLFPGHLKIKKITGTLFSGFSLETISYQTKEKNISIESLTTSWHPKQLLKGKLEIDSLIIKKPQIILLKINSTSHTFSPVDLKFLNHININHLIIDSLSIKKAGLQFYLTGELKENWKIHWKLDIPKLSVLAGGYTGSLKGLGAITGKRLTPTINANINGNEILLWPNFSEFMSPQQKVSMIIKLNLMKLSALHNFIPEIQKARGIIEGNLNVRGVVSQPKVAGTLNLKQGHVAISALGIHLNDITVHATIDKPNIISLRGNLRSAKGTAQFQGNLDLNKPAFPTVLTFQGNNLTAVHLPHFKVIISPNITLSYSHPKLTVQGKIAIPQATIRLKSYFNTVSLPNETVFVGQTKPEMPSFLLATQLNIELNLGRDIFFAYKDFETQLGGKLIIDQFSNNPAIATGEIYSIKGKYSIYGQHLLIKTGRLIFTGNVITNPGLHIEAIRKIKEVSTSSSAANVNVAMPSFEDATGTTTVGIRILGTANNPQITLFSIPAGLTQAQILSGLGAEGAALMGALSTLHPDTSHISGLTDKLNKILGLAEVNISSVQIFNPTTNQIESTPSFIIGKQISRKLSLHYSVGIFNPVSILNVRYQFNKHWAIQSETSTIDNGADILYTIERQ
ncbi:MAG: tamB [Gammaproteobacteria bacterium]|jgi:autotransporter translocation and assembly factor TamB|nr:tamB [Gammaproteobacteria bacterium]